MKTRGIIELSACTLEYACGECLESEGDEASFEPTLRVGGAGLTYVGTWVQGKEAYRDPGREEESDAPRACRQHRSIQTA